MAPRPKYHASQGTTVEMHGTPAASAASEAGLTDSGVDVASSRSTPSEWIRSLATCALTDGVAWLSFWMIWTSQVLPPTTIPFAKAFLARPTT